MKEEGHIDNRVILFDCFGLFMSDPYRRFFAEKLGPDYAAIKDQFCAPGDLGEISYEEFLQNIGNYFHMDPEEIREQAKRGVTLFPEMIELAKRCKKVRPVYLLSNCMDGMIEEYLPLDQLVACFDKMFLSNEIHLIKPKPESFQYVLDALGIEPERIYFYDDNERNIIAANRLGIHGVLFTSVEACENDLKSKGLL